MSSSFRRIRRTLDSVAFNNESAALAVMRAAERTSCLSLRQQLLDVVHSLNQDAEELRQMRGSLSQDDRKIA